MKETIFQLLEFGIEKPCVTELKGFQYLLFIFYFYGISLQFVVLAVPICDENFLLENYSIIHNAKYIAQYLLPLLIM